MALKQVMLRKKIEQRKSSLQELLTREAELETRSKELEQAVEEAHTDEEMEAVNAEVEQHEAEVSEIDQKKTTLETEIQQLESDLEELNNAAPTNNPTPTPAPAGKESERSKNRGGEMRMKGNRHETRSQMVERLNQPEVREFYETITTAVKEKRALSGTEVTIPVVVLDMVQTRIGDYSKLYSEVNVVPITGEARIIMDGAIPEALWTEMCDPVKELADAFSDTELDGYKVGGFIPVCNAVLEDSMINLANFIEGRLAKSIAKAIDKAILKGSISAKQPTGIITAVTAEQPDHVVNSDGTLPDIMKYMALIDDGEDGDEIDEVIVVMRRSTYYSRIAPQTYVQTADGRLIIQPAAGARMPDGSRIVFSQHAPVDTIVMGDFSKYLLAERAGVKITSSTEVRFIEDQTVFKGTARYDGKPVYPEYFVIINLAPLEATASA